MSHYGNIVILGSHRLYSSEESDSRTLLGYLMLRKLLKEKKSSPQVLIELMDPSNRLLFEDCRDQVIISPMLVSRMLAQIALIPELAAVHSALFGVDTTELYFRPIKDYEINKQDLSFDQIQNIARARAETAIGLYMPRAMNSNCSSIVLNPEHGQTFQLKETDSVIVIANYGNIHE